MNAAEELTRSLHEQADRIGGRPIDLESVRGRARTIQRRRRITTGAVVAAVLALAVPVGMGVAGVNHADGPDPAPEPTIEPAPLHRDGSFRLDPEAAPEGESPRIPYYVGNDLRQVTPEGSFDFPGDVAQVARYGDGWIGLESGDFPPAGFRVVTMDEDLEVLGTVPAGLNLAVSDDGSRVAWTEVVEGRGTLVNAPTGGGEVTRVPITGEWPSAVGFLDDGRVVFSTTERETAATEYAVATTGGDVTAFGGFQTVTGTSEVSGLVAGQTKYLGDSTCSAAVDPVAGGQPVWETCDHSVGDFSPDGRYLIGLASYVDNGSPSLAILDAETGDPVVEYRGPRTTFIGVQQVVWEDADTLLATVTHENEETMLRFELDGRVSRVTRTLPTGHMSIEYGFPNHLFR